MATALHPPGGEGWHLSRNRRRRIHYFPAQRTVSLCGAVCRPPDARPIDPTGQTPCRRCESYRHRLDRMTKEGRSEREMRREAEIWAAMYQAPGPVMGDDGSI